MFQATPATIGAMRLRLAIERPDDVPDDSGGVTRGWQAAGACWGALTPLSGTERLMADRLESALTHRIEIRWREGVAAGQRLRAGSRVFAIKALTDPDGSRRRLVGLVEEIEPGMVP